MILTIDMGIQKSGVVIYPFVMSSSGVILRVSSLFEGRGPYFLILDSGMRCFKWALCMSISSCVGKYLNYGLTGDFMIYHDQTSICRKAVYLDRLMGVAAMMLKLEKIFFIKIYHPPD